MYMRPDRFSGRVFLFGFSFLALGAWLGSVPRFFG